MSASCSICHAEIFFWKTKCVLLLSVHNFYLHCGYLCYVTMTKSTNIMIQYSLKVAYPGQEKIETHLSMVMWF